MESFQLDTYPMPLNGLRYFYWVAKLTSFKLAAEKLHVSEAAISQQIRNLETSLEVKLFNREHQKISLTDKGRNLFPFVQTAFINLQEGISSIAKDPNPQRLYISAIPSYATNWLIRRLAKFNKAYPEISISIDTSIELLDTELNPHDLYIRYGTGNYNGLESVFLMNDPVVLVSHHSLVSNGKITRNSFLSAPFIIGTSCTVIESMEAFKKFFNVSPNSQQETLLLTDGSLGVEAVRAKQGMTLQRMSLVIDYIKSGELVYSTDYAFREFSFYACATEANMKKPKVALFIDWLKAEMKQTNNQITPYLEKIKK